MKIGFAVTVLALALAACSGDGNGNEPGTAPDRTPTEQGQARMRPDVEATGPEEALPPGSVIVHLRPNGRMGQAGTARLEQLPGGATKITLEISPTRVGRQPAQIQLKECRLAGTVQWELNDVVNGRSVTTVTRSVGWIREAQVSVNVMQSQRNYTPTACGNVPPPVG